MPRTRTLKTLKRKDPEPMDVLVDILLSLLAQPSALLRDVVEHVFKSVDALRVGGERARHASRRARAGRGR